jgi:tetratricopeptide (TPR) repeat protein
VVFSERRTLEEIEMPTEEDLKRIDELKTQQSAFEARALALYLETLERVSADERFLNRILWLNTDSTTETFLLGKLYAVRGDPLAAEGRFEKALEEDPAYVQALVASGDLAVDQRNYPFAKLRYQAALDLRSQDVGILLKLVNVHLASDKLADAAVTIDRIRDLDPTNVRLRIAEGDLAANRLKAAVKEQETLLETESRTEADEARMAQLETKIAEEYETARSKYDDALRSGGAEEVRVKLGYVHLLNGEFEEAQREFRLALRGFTYNADAYEGLGDALLQMGDEESALANLELALSHAADARQGERVLRKILEVVPDDTDARLLYAGALAAQYKWSDAIREYGRVLDKNADSVDAYVGIARAYLERAEHEAALGYLWQGLRRETSAEERETLYTAVVDVIADEVGPSAPFPPEGLDAVIEIARLRLADDDRETALQYLMWLQDMDEEYRKDVVRSLIVAAGGEVPPSAEEDDLPENGD